jgi:hypothetical protein
MTLYVRDHGVICVEASILGSDAAIAELPRQLLSSGMAWYWESARREAPREDHVSLGLPDERSLTALTDQSGALLVADLRERDRDGYGRSLALFGLDAEHRAAGGSREGWRAVLREFATHETGPVRIVLVQPGDANEDYVFVPHVPAAATRVLLERWSIQPDAAHDRRPYRRLGIMQLEGLSFLAGGSTGS